MYPTKYVCIVFALYCIYFHLKPKLFFAPLLNNLKKKLLHTYSVSDTILCIRNATSKE